MDQLEDKYNIWCKSGTSIFCNGDRAGIIRYRMIEVHVGHVTCGIEVEGQITAILLEAYLLCKTIY